MSLTEKYALQFGISPQKNSKTLTSSFKSTQRQKKSMFTQRLVKDFNNLQYEVAGSLIRKTFHKQPKKTSRKILSGKDQTVLKRIQSAPKIDVRERNIEIQNYELPERVIAVESREKQITRDLKNRMGKTASTDDFEFKTQNFMSTLGLSEFEVQNTIIGKIAKRSSHHLVFEKQPNRPQNVQKVWYQEGKVFTPLDREDKKNKIEKIHNFKSYQPHKSFKPTENLDKFYKVHESSKKVAKRDDINTRELQKMKDRDPIPIKLGTQLDYGKLGSLEKKKTMPMFRICRSQRKLKFSRQVISPERGCYR